jgi:hypothetical protein
LYRLRKHFFGCCVEVVVELVVVDALCAIACCWERMLDILTAIGIETINNKKGSAENDECNNQFFCCLFLQI